MYSHSRFTAQTMGCGMGDPHAHRRRAKHAYASPEIDLGMRESREVSLGLEKYSDRGEIEHFSRNPYGAETSLDLSKRIYFH